MQVIDVPTAHFFNLLRFVSNVGHAMQQVQDKHWNDAATVWPSAWVDLAAWTELAIRNAPRSVPDEGGSCDSF